jgi:hypothetical protein
MFKGANGETRPDGKEAEPNQQNDPVAQNTVEGAAKAQKVGRKAGTVEGEVEHDRVSV